MPQAIIFLLHKLHFPPAATFSYYKIQSENPSLFKQQLYSNKVPECRDDKKRNALSLLALGLILKTGISRVILLLQYSKINKQSAKMLP